MILSFKQQFVDPILKDVKIHTLREDVHKRWIAGRSIEMATGVRTKHYDQFNAGIPKLGKCISVQKVFITVDNGLEISIDGRHLDNHEVDEISINDGFNTTGDMEQWFEDVIKKEKTDCWSGKLIHWTDKRY